ncbi:MAG: hypothetical protein HDR71_20085 [Lachnospiraceae bacterium]|nr:hypothetical protein [Lachnospiraceae bacterium]
MKQRLKWDEIIGILFFLASIGMLGISVYFCFGSDIWYDELFTLGLADQSLSDLVSITARDVHPPFYYLIVKLFLTGTGESDLARQVAAAKLVSCLPFFICILFSMNRIRKNFGLLTAGLFSFLLISMPQMADYTVEIRMYGFALVFITVGMVSAYELMDKQTLGRWTMLTVSALLACYTHYFACVAACLIYLYLLIGMWRRKKQKNMLKPYLASGIMCAVCYLPWFLLVVTKQVGRVRENYWIQPVSWRTLGGCVKFIFKPSFTNEKLNAVLAAVFFFIYAAVLLIVIFTWIKKKKENSQSVAFAMSCIGILAGLVFFGMAASIVMKPIFVYRYMLPAMGVFWLAFAILLSGFKERKAVLIPVLLFLVIIGIRNFRSFYGEEMWKKLQMETALNELEQIGSDDIIIYNFDQLQAVASYYLENDTYLWYGNTEELIREMFPRNHALVEGEFSDEAGIARMKELMHEGRTVWFLGSGNAREEILKKWEQEGIYGEEKASVMIERYWFNFYHLNFETE